MARQDLVEEKERFDGHASGGGTGDADLENFLDIVVGGLASVRPPVALHKGNQLDLRVDLSLLWPAH